MSIIPDDVDERNERRDTRVLEAAERLIRARGISTLTREAIADVAGVSPTSVSNFGRTRITNGEPCGEGYRSRILRAVMDVAIERADLSMLRIGIYDGCLRPENLPDNLRAVIGAY